MAIRIKINGKIIGKGRPRTNFRTGIIYTPKATKDYEKYIRYLIQTSGIKGNGSISIDLECHFALPKNTSKKKVAELIDKPCLKKPDVDNIAKIYLDAFNGHLYDDDKQVYMITAKKVWDIEEFVICIIHNDR